MAVIHATVRPDAATAPAPAGLPGVPGRPGGARVILAPLCGITTAPFRRIALACGAELVVTEMVSSEAITRGKRADCRALRGLDPRVGPFAIQIFGGDPERMGETAARLADEFHPVFIDMNFGCPVRKIVRGGGGSAVLRDLDLLGRICRRVVERAGVPVTAKIRAGWDRATGRQVRDIVRVIEDAGVVAVAVHARTRRQAFAGRADWDLIAEAVDAVDIPVVGNGDVRSPDDAERMVRHTGCAAVMIGRAAIGNPWILGAVRARFDGRPWRDPDLATRIATLRWHAREAVALEGEPGGLVAMRRTMAAYVKHMPQARELRGRLMQVTRLDELEAVLRERLDAGDGDPARPARRAASA